MFTAGICVGFLIHVIYWKLSEKYHIEKLCDEKFEELWYECD